MLNAVTVSNSDLKKLILSKLPQSYVQYAGGELLRDQIIVFLNRATEQGSTIKVNEYPTQFHIFQILGPILSDSKDAILKIAEFIKSVDRKN